jgi:hypothetical protein
LAIVASDTKNERAIFAVVSPARVRSVRASRPSKGRAGWQQVNINRRRSSGILSVPAVGSREILDLLDDRVVHGSLIILSQLLAGARYECLGERAVADAINNAIPVERTEESMHKIQSKRKEANGAKTLGTALEERLVQTLANKCSRG